MLNQSLFNSQSQWQMSQLRLLSTSNPGQKEVDTPSCSCTPQTKRNINDMTKNSSKS